MMSFYPDPEQSNIRDSLGLLIVWIIAFIVLVLTLPGCQSDDQKQKYQPYVAPPAPAVDRIRPAVHEAATRVDDVLEKTPVPAVANVLADDLLDTIEKIEALPPPTAADPKVAEIIDPDIEPISITDISEPTTDDGTEESTFGIASWTVILVGLSALVFFVFKMLKGTDQDDKDLKRKASAS
tara:strand:- start:29339 stop:29884 length:546 start_codon:yes stop_codon:yes gene_type:complete